MKRGCFHVILKAAPCYFILIRFLFYIVKMFIHLIVTGTEIYRTREGFLVRRIPASGNDHLVKEGFWWKDQCVKKTLYLISRFL